MLDPLKQLVDKLTHDNSVRAPRRLAHIFTCLAALNRRFSTDIPSDIGGITFVQEYFTCLATCLSCRTRCCLGINHISDGVPHQAMPHESSYYSAHNLANGSIEQTSGRSSAGNTATNPCIETPGCLYDSRLQNKIYYCNVSYTHFYYLIPLMGLIGLPLTSEDACIMDVMLHSSTA
ncbi:unnamed protein product [Protopolystoma xenopodis]|uniref:Uncharacterized protein n=1 Tax=Protopolystoma xenopodis TaxID=117903 RepID=A0A3S5A7S6_9PLAT|nr:unnamed protein product [Protopolystoma xenopodis]